MPARRAIRYAMLVAAVAAAVALAQLAVASAALGAPLTSRPQIALTFDDAPTTATARVLGPLQDRGATATFFVVGDASQQYPEQARAIAGAGMLIGNHSHDHTPFATKTADEIRSNLTSAQVAIHAVTGVTPRWFRPPYLDPSPHYDSVLPQLGLRISWPTINPKDWSGVSAQSIVDIVTRDAEPGAVVILHDMPDLTNTVEALPDLIDELHALGYKLVTLDDIGFGAIEGVVTAGSGGALVGATVSALDAGGTVVASTTTTADGAYRLAPLPSGAYRVGVAALGHESAYYDGAVDLVSAEHVVVTTDYVTQGANTHLVTRTALTAHASTTRPRYGERVVITGRLKSAAPGSAALPDKFVRLQVLGPTGWVDSYTPASTNPSGETRFEVSPRDKTSYRLVFDGVEGEFASRTSAPVVVTPKFLVSTPLAPATAKRGRLFTVSGTLRPPHRADTPRVRIYRWRKVGKTWRSYGFVRASMAGRGAYSSYAARLRLPHAGVWRLRAYAPGDALHAGSWSSRWDDVRVK